jgi:hypothetical protein
MGDDVKTPEEQLQALAAMMSPAELDVLALKILAATASKTASVTKSPIDRHRASFNQLYPLLQRDFPTIAAWWDGWVADFEVIDFETLQITLINGDEKRSLRVLRSKLKLEESIASASNASE